jgi:guanosine-3',5'-bis(diphosphate) 3'-pyrophosphohydrolase
MQMEKLLDRAREFALTAHGTQMYGVRPYSVHLDAVVGLLEPFGIDAQIIGYLHDVVEDTDTTANDIKAVFGGLVSTCVELLTDADGKNRKEKKQYPMHDLRELMAQRHLHWLSKLQTDFQT